MVGTLFYIVVYLNIYVILLKVKPIKHFPPLLPSEILKYNFIIYTLR